MMIQKNDRDTVIEEIHQVRRQINDKFDGDIATILDDARKRQVASGRAIWQGKTMRASGEIGGSENG